MDNKLFLSGRHLDLRNDADFGIIQKWHYEKKISCTPQDYYDVINQYRQNNKFILQEMKREYFVATKNLQNAIPKRVRKNTNGEKVNWPKILVG